MNRLLKVKEIPFLLSIIITAIGAVVVSIGDNITEIPILEYSFQRRLSRHEVVISNLSRTSFRKITLIVECDTDHAIHHVDNPNYLPPAMEASSNKLPFQSAPNEWEYQLGPLQPRNRIHVSFQVMEDADYCLRFMTHDQTALVTTPNLTTFIVKNETLLLISLLAFLVLGCAAFYTLYALNGDEP